MDDPLVNGKSLTRVNLWRIFAVSVIVTWIGASQPEAAATAWPRLVLIGLCCVLVYRGYRWALWVLGLLTVLAGAFMVVLAFVMADLHWTDRVLFGVLGALQVAAFVILSRAPEVRAFMAAQRGGASTPSS